MNNKKITSSLILAENPSIIKTAERFMKDNGFKKNMQGKLVACNEIDSWHEDTNTETLLAIKTAIMLL